MTEENPITQEQLEILKQGIEKATENVENHEDIELVKKTEPVKLKYPQNVMCRCNMKFFLLNGIQYENEINISMDRIQMIQEKMASSLENKEGAGVIYLEGSKNCEADFTIIPVKNIVYMKFEVEETKS